MLDFKAIHNDLLPKQEYTQWFPGKVQGSTYRAVNHIRGGESLNLWIMLKGNHPGCWGDYVETSICGSSLLLLYCYWAGIQGWNSSDSKTVGKAMYEAAKRLGYAGNLSFAEKSSLNAEKPGEDKNRLISKPVFTEEALTQKKKAQSIWNKAKRLPREVIDRYYKNRGLDDFWLFSEPERLFDCMRFIQDHPYYSDDGKLIGKFPCIITPFRKCSSDEVVAIQQLWMSPDFRKKAFSKDSSYPSRKFRGSPTEAAMRFPSPNKAVAGNHLYIGEGTENVLSFLKLKFEETGIWYTGWAAGSASNVSNVILPGKADVAVVMDKDETGLRAVEHLEKNCKEKGITFLGSCIPPAEYKDWNDYLVKRSNSVVADDMPDLATAGDSEKFQQDKEAAIASHELNPLTKTVDNSGNSIKKRLGDLSVYERQRANTLAFLKDKTKQHSVFEKQRRFVDMMNRIDI